MVPNLVFDMTSLLVPFCAGCLGFALVGLGALVAVAMGERPRRRSFQRVEMGGVTMSEGSARPVEQNRAAA
jgi:hypothetical protein